MDYFWAGLFASNKCRANLLKKPERSDGISIVGIALGLDNTFQRACSLDILHDIERKIIGWCGTVNDAYDIRVSKLPNCGNLPRKALISLARLTSFESFQRPDAIKFCILIFDQEDLCLTAFAQGLAGQFPAQILRDLHSLILLCPWPQRRIEPEAEHLFPPIGSHVLLRNDLIQALDNLG